MYRVWLLLLTMLTSTQVVIAQEDAAAFCGLLDDGSAERFACESFAQRPDSEIGENVRASLRESIESPAVLNKVVSDYLIGEHGWQFLRDVNFAFKAFESDNIDETTLGVGYDYGQSVTEHELTCADPACIRGLDLSFSAAGNVAFESDDNPRNFLNTEFNFSWYQSKGGVHQPTSAQREKIHQQVAAFVAAADEDQEEQEIQELVSAVRETLSPQLYVSLGASAALESDQSFDTKQYVWSAQAGVDFKDWTNNSAWAKFNIIDFPAALIRAASGYDGCGKEQGSCFRPRGTAWPTVLIGFSRVTPQDEDPRAIAGDSSDFTRSHVEIAYRSPIADFHGENVYLSASWRQYKELDAIDSIRAENLDEYALTTLVLGGSEGIYMSYSHGKLPFAVGTDDVFELGFQFKL